MPKPPHTMRAPGTPVEADGPPEVPVHTGDIEYPGKPYSELKDEDDALDTPACKILLGWWPEPKGQDWKDDYDIRDVYGKKVRFVHNVGNRNCEEKVAYKYAYELLNGNWAGPTAMPGETVNGEPVIISRTAAVKSGQKRLAGKVLADQMWELSGQPRGDKGDRWPDWKEKWPDAPPPLETFLTYGVSDDIRVTRTFDTGQERSGADTFTSMDVFGQFSGTEVVGGKPLGRGDKKELTKTLDNGVKMLWEESAAGDSEYTPYRTQTGMAVFVDKHPQLLDAVMWVYKDGGDKIARFARPGEAAALFYLMAASKTEWVAYDTGRSEEQVDLSRWDDAKEFWLGLGKADTEPKSSKFGFRNVQTMAYPRENDPAGVAGFSGSIFAYGKGAQPAPSGVKQSALALAWGLFAAKGVEGLTVPALRLGFEVSRDRDTGLVDEQAYTKFDDERFGGIQAPDKKPGDAGSPPPPRVEDVWAALTALREEWPGYTLLFKSVPLDDKTGKPNVRDTYYAMNGDEDVQTAEKVLGLERLPVGKDSPPKATFPLVDMLDHLPKLHAAGLKVAIVDKVDGKFEVKEQVPPPPKEPAAKGNGKPPAAKTPPKAAAVNKPAAPAKPAKPKNPKAAPAPAEAV